MYFLRKMNPARSWNDPSIQHFQIACRETTNVHIIFIADPHVVELLFDNIRQIRFETHYVLHLADMPESSHAIPFSSCKL